MGVGEPSSGGRRGEFLVVSDLLGEVFDVAAMLGGAGELQGSTGGFEGAGRLTGSSIGKGKSVEDGKITMARELGSALGQLQGTGRMALAGVGVGSE